MKYNIYAGLSGSFGGAQYVGTGDFSSRDSAEETAYEYAVEEYESYEGSHGILSWYDVAQERGLVADDPDNEEEIYDFYREEIESWIEYYAVLFEEDNLNEEIIEL